MRHQRVHPSGPRRYPVLVQIRERPRLEARGDALLRGDVDRRYRAEPTCAQTEECADRGVHARQLLGLPLGKQQRRAVRVAHLGQHATEGGDGEIRCRPIPARSVDAERGHPT